MIPSSRHLTIASSLFAVFALLWSPLRTLSQTSTPSISGDHSSALFQLKVNSNLVVVRVVVRDAEGKPVEGLRKEDFRLFDQGKEQTIAQFDVETALPPPSGSALAHAPDQSLPSTAPAIRSFIALYFDDLNSSDADIIQARDAADHYLAANLRPNNQVAVFTSGQVLSDFTSDPQRIHEALLKLHVSARSLAQDHYCPDLSDFQALQITQNDEGALAVATDEAAHCEGGVLMPPGGMGGAGLTNAGGGIATMVIRTLAQNIVNQSGEQARVNLQQLEQVVKHLSQMPGLRTLILVSPGFLSQSEQYPLDRLTDHALRSQVVISALDPKGLAILMREADTSRSYIPATNPGILEAARRVDSQRELVATAVLANLAQGTGGEFFHNSNDLKAGFGALAGSSVYYILAFAPSGMKQDNKFHELKVALAEKEKGLRIRARRGYFASREGEAAPEAAAVAQAKEAEPKKNDGTAPDPEDQTQRQIREAILSKTESMELPVALDVKLAPGQGETRDLSLSAHLDASSLHFQKDGERNLNTVTFVFAVFDQKENLVNAQQRRAKINVLDGQLPGLLKGGVDVNATFHLKPGLYRIREVATDSEDHHLSTLSRDVTVQ